MKQHWERVYKEKSHLEVSWYQGKPMTSLSLIKNLSLDKNDRLVDIGGGASTLIDCLLDEGFENCTVLDISDFALELAKKHLGKKSASVNWRAEDVIDFAPEFSYTLWHDRAVFHFLTDRQDREKYKKVLASSVSTGGYVIIAAFALAGPTKCSGLDIVRYDAQKMEDELGPRFNLVDEKTETHITPSGVEQLFGFYVFRKVN
ncbi:MAG: methyltransferase domain-containing protein [Gammaproteobacteria bacterium]|nr:methyltransferase domain-containing protein [Gammaproteobacteria bacterium]